MTFEEEKELAIKHTEWLAERCRYISDADALYELSIKMRHCVAMYELAPLKEKVDSIYKAGNRSGAKEEITKGAQRNRESHRTLDL